MNITEKTSKMDVIVKEKYFEDSCMGEDYLNMNVYADALSEIIKKKNNINIGIYAEWGQGKSFLMNLLKEKLKLSEKEKEDKYIDEASCFFCGCNNNITKCIINCFNSNFEIHNKENDDSCMCFKETDIEMGCKKIKKKCFYCGIANDEDNCFLNCLKKTFGCMCQTSEEYVIVDFNAWIYEGSDNLWAGLIERLHSRMEDHFGWLRIRWFRLFDYEYPTFRDKIGLFFLYIFYIGFPCLIGILFWYIFESYGKDYASFVSILIGSSASGCFILSKILKIIWELSKSQAEEIIKNSNKTQEKLGFMNEVKKEVEIISQFLKYNEKRVVIFIDDLDRCKYNKAVDVLNSVMLLLSEKDSRFITFFAIDPRIVIKSIESTYSDSLLNAGINGFEYLDKIIQIPFVLSQKVLSKNNKKIFIKNLIEIDHNTDILNKLEKFIDTFLLTFEIKEVLNMNIVNYIINTGNSFTEIEKIYSEQMKNYNNMNEKNYIFIKKKYLTYDTKYNLNLLKYINDNKNFCEDINNKRKKNLFLKDHNHIINNIICILKSTGSLSEEDLDLLILNLFYIKGKIKAIKTQQKIDDIIKIFKDYYDKVIQKIFFVRINKENITKKFLNKIINLGNTKCNFFENNFNNILELIIKEDENLEYFDQESKNKNIILESIMYIQNASENKNFLHKFIPYKMIMITINNEDFENYFVNKYINLYLSKNKDHLEFPKIQLKSNNIKCEVFPKIIEYDNILKKYFNSENNSINMMNRNKYLDNKHKVLLSNKDFFLKYYNNNIEKNSDNNFVKINQTSPNIIIKETEEINILNSLYDFNETSYDNQDNFLNYQIKNDITFKINYLFKNYIPSFYDYMKNTISKNTIEIDNYKIKNWSLLRNDSYGECLKYIISVENLFYKYLNNYSIEEIINDKNYEFTLRRPLLILPFVNKSDNYYYFNSNFLNLSLNSNKLFKNKSSKKMDKDNDKKCLIDVLKEDVNILRDQQKMMDKNINNFYIVPNVEYSKIVNQEKLFTENNQNQKNIITDLHKELNYQNCYILNTTDYCEDNKFYIIENDKDLIDELNNYYSISNKQSNIIIDNNFVEKTSNNIIDNFITSYFEDSIDYEKNNIKPNIIYKSLYRNYLNNDNENNEMKQEKKSFDLIIKIKSKHHQRSKLLFDNYINNKQMDKDASMIKDSQGKSIGQVNIKNGRKRKLLNSELITINKDIDILYKELKSEIDNNKWEEKDIEILKKEYTNILTKDMSELKNLIIDYKNLNNKMNIHRDEYEYYNKLKMIYYENENMDLIFDAEKENNLFNYLLSYNCIDKLFLLLNEFKIYDISENNFSFSNKLTFDNILEENNINESFNEIYSLHSDIDINDINICSMGMNIFKYDKMIDRVTENFDNDKDKSLFFMDRETYKKLLLKDLIKNESWGYDRNYYDATLYLKNKKSQLKTTYEFYEDYPAEILHNCINLYYDYLNNKSEHILTNIKDKTIYKKLIFEMSMHNRIDAKKYNVKFNNKDINIQKKIIKELDNIYKNYTERKKSGFILNKETVQLFSKYLIDYRKDEEGNIIGGSNYDYIRDFNFHLLTLKDKQGGIYDDLSSHPFSLDESINYFLNNVSLKDALKIVKSTLMKVSDDMVNYTLSSYKDLFILYKDLENLIEYSNERDLIDLIDSCYNDYVDSNKIFDIPSQYQINIDIDNIDIIYNLIRDYPIYNFYVEFKHFIYNLCKNMNNKFIENHRYKIDKNEWKIFNKKDNIYFLHKETGKIYKNIKPSIGLKIFSINDIYINNLADIFTKILYGYNLDYLKQLDSFQLYMWEKRRDFNNRVYNDNTIEISMTTEELDLIYTCLDFLKPNPRKIKRILNIISLTRYILNNSPFLLKNINFEKNLIYRFIIKFTILYEQWPYRTTWLSIWIKECYELNNDKDYYNFINQELKTKWFPEKLSDSIIDKSNQFKSNHINNFLKNTSLEDMYYYIEEYIFSSEKLINLSKMDCDPDLFCQFLRLDVCGSDENRECLRHCLDMIEIEKINFNHNPAILATCITEVNKLQINMKYNKDSKRISNLLLKDAYQKGFPIRKIKDDYKQKESNNDFTINESSENIQNICSKNDDFIINKLPENIQNIYSDIDDEFFDPRIHNEEEQKIIDVIMNKGELKNIKIDINEK
jgi:hypothetical protein